VQRGRQACEAVDDDGNDGERSAEEVERDHDAVVELELLGGGEVHLLRHAFGEGTGQARVTGHPTAGDLHELLVRRPPELVGDANAEGRHVIQEEVGPVLGRHDHQHIRTRGFEPRAELPVCPVHRLGLGGRRERGPSGDAGRVARHEGADEAHVFVPRIAAR
jgi:hypothetical protein